MPDTPATGTIGWIDLTVPNAEAVREFYQHVAGWTASPVAMGEHNDYCMVPAGASKPVAGVCHALGENAAMPPIWVIYIMVADLEASLTECLARGGKQRSSIRTAGSGRFCLIEDPAGAVAGLYQPQ